MNAYAGVPADKYKTYMKRARSLMNISTDDMFPKT